MPLPEPKTAWPPLDPTIQHGLADWSAWYSGDPDQLTDRYLNRSALGAQNRPSQYRGGILGRFARWWWGEPTPDGEKRTKLHVPLAADICRTSAELLFAEPLRLTADDRGTQQWLDDLMPELHTTLLEAGEVCAALGGVYLRLVWDRGIAERPWIAPVHADGALPAFSHGRLREVTFWRVLDGDDRTVVRHLEHHERGYILHGLYEGTPHTLGKRLALTAREETRQYAATGGVIRTGITLLTASYIPNMRPNRLWRTLPAAAGWGQPDLGGIEPELDALDETWSSLMRDIRLAKGRMVVPDAYLQSLGVGQGSRWEDREAFVGLDMLPRADGSGSQITISQFAIRVEEHLATARALVEQAVRGAGYSASTFGDDSDGAQPATATEVIARRDRTMTTRGRKILYQRPGVVDIVQGRAALERSLFAVSDIEVVRPRIEWPDGVAESPKTVAETVDLLSRAEAASRRTLVRMQHPDWDDTTVAEETARILAEYGRATADPTLTGADRPLLTGGSDDQGDDGG